MSFFIISCIHIWTASLQSTFIKKREKKKVLDQTFCMFKSTLKNKVVTSYNDKCIDPNNCVSCKSARCRLHGLVGVDVVDAIDGV